jgi:2-polyprenyl-6-methoxyphenol hydroxylase-like FAD-dependent oxidoreductase
MGNPKADHSFDVCVSGSGIVGKALALALSRDGWKVAWAAGPAGGEATTPQREDVRAYALNAQTVALLQRLRVWEGIAPHATPLHDMRIEGDAAGHLGFSAWQQCVTELGFIADAGVMEQVLAEALRYAPHVVKVAEVPANVPLWAICEGKHSAQRAQLRAEGHVQFERQAYEHWGVAARLTHALPHNGVARQWFFASDTSPDVLALLPFHAPQPGASYGLVWSTPPDNAKRLVAMNAAEFEQALHARLAAGQPEADQPWRSLKLVSSVAAWPLARGCAKPWVGKGWALLGDAAHLVHPLAGQGLNLGLADVAALVQVLHEAREAEPWRSIGDERVLQRYERARWFDTQAMLTLTDSLVHLFGNANPVVRDLRNMGMNAVNGLGPLKRWLVNQALGQQDFSSTGHP